MLRLFSHPKWNLVVNIIARLVFEGKLIFTYSFDVSDEDLRFCPLCSKPLSLTSYIFMFCLLVKDETAELPAILYGEDAVKCV